MDLASSATSWLTGCALALTFPLGGALANNARSTAFCRLPVNSSFGVHYSNAGGDDAETSGPTALTVDKAGNFVIADEPQNRLVFYSQQCRFLRALDLPKSIVSVADVISNGDMWILDVASAPPTVWRLNAAGGAVGRATIGDELEDGFINLRALSPGSSADDVFVMRYDAQTLGVNIDASGRAAGVAKTSTDGIITHGRQTESAVVDNTSGAAKLTIDGVVHTLRLGSGLIGFRIISPFEGGVLTKIERRTGDRLHTFVAFFDADGILRTAAEIPSDGLFYIANNIAIDASAQVFVAVARDSYFEIHRVELGPAAVVTAPDDGAVPVSHDGDALRSRAERSTAMPGRAPANFVCPVDRDAIVPAEQTYLNNTSFISATSIDPNDKQCPTRVKPKYLKAAGNYSSVSYAYGGSDTPSIFDQKMASNIDAGNLTGILTCAAGIDCSGFVSNTWNLTTRLSTTGLDGVSTALGNKGTIVGLKLGDILNSAGKHVVIFASATTSSVSVCESEGSNLFGRVVCDTQPLAKLAKYTPRLYNNMCEPIIVSFSCGSSSIESGTVHMNLSGQPFSYYFENDTVQKTVAGTVTFNASTGLYGIATNFGFLDSSEFQAADYSCSGSWNQGTTPDFNVSCTYTSGTDNFCSSPNATFEVLYNPYH